MPLTIGRWHQHLDVLADDLCFGIAEQLFGGRAERNDGADLIDNDHRVGHRRQDRAQVRFGVRRVIRDGQIHETDDSNAGPDA